MFTVSQLTTILCAILSNSKSSFKSNQNKQYGAYSNSFHSLDFNSLGFKGNSTLRKQLSSITNYIIILHSQLNSSSSDFAYFEMQLRP